MKIKTLNHIFVSHALFLSLFAGATYATAQEDPVSDPDPINTSEQTNVTREEIKNNTEERQAERKEKMTERQEAVNNNLSEQRENIKTARQDRQTEQQTKAVERKIQLKARTQERVTNLAANMSNRTEAIIDRLQNITNRFASRLDKLAEVGIDTTEAKSALSAAQTEINLTTSEITNIDTAISQALGSNNVRNDWQGVREKFTNTRTHLKSAHTNLRASLAYLKVAVNETSNTRVSDTVKTDNATTIDNN